MCVFMPRPPLQEEIEKEGAPRFEELIRTVERGQEDTEHPSTSRTQRRYRSEKGDLPFGRAGDFSETDYVGRNCRERLRYTLPLRRVVGGILDIWVHGEHFKGAEVEVRSFAGWSKTREELGHRLPFILGARCNKINLTSESTISELTRFFLLLRETKHLNMKATKIEIYVKVYQTPSLSRSIPQLLVSVYTSDYQHYLSQLICTTTAAWHVAPRMLRSAGSFNLSLFYDCRHERASSPCQEVQSIYQQVAIWGVTREAITEPRRDLGIELEVLASCHRPRYWRFEY